MTPDERIEKLLNRAGQTISDLPKGDGRHLVYNKELRKSADAAQMKWHGIRTDSLVDVVDGLNMALDYILHLSEVVDRYDEALTRLCDLRDRHVHIVGNVDPPEGVTHEQLIACIEAIIDATEKYRAGLEPWDDWWVDDETD